MDDLGHGDEVDILVDVPDLVQPVEKGVEELRVVLEPSGVVEETEGRPVLLVVPVEVVVEKVVELLLAADGAAGVHHGAAREVLLHAGVLPPVQLVHHDLPDGQRPGRAVLEVPVASKKKYIHILSF